MRPLLATVRPLPEAAILYFNAVQFWMLCAELYNSSERVQRLSLLKFGNSYSQSEDGSKSHRPRTPDISRYDKVQPTTSQLLRQQDSIIIRNPRFAQNIQNFVL